MRATFRGLARRDLLWVLVASGIALLLAVLLVRRTTTRDGRANHTWAAGTSAHPILGRHFAGGAVLRTYYPDNPRGYFENTVAQETKGWQLVVHDSDSRAELVAVPNKPEVLHVRIGAAPKHVAWHVQLNQPSVVLVRADSYTVTFRARASGPRSIAFGVSQAHDPWLGLGLYREVAVDTAWRDIADQFVATESDDRTRLHFDVGADTEWVELTNIVVRGRRGGASNTTSAASGASVTYRFNETGCRGADYAAARDSTSWRVLMLGDSYAMGAGVHEHDTFAARLQDGLNRKHAGGQSRFEVINCSVPGWGTRQQRLFYELYAARYMPDVILLVMTGNDDRLSSDDTPGAGARFDLRFMRQSVFPAVVTKSILKLSRSAEWPDDAVQELRQLSAAVRRDGARLAVAIFRTGRGESWDALTRGVGRGLGEESVPVLDLGVALLAGHDESSLRVHPRLDSHPNEVAHGIVADALLAFLDGDKLLGMREQSPRGAK